MKTYVFKVTLNKVVKFIPVSASNVLKAVNIMKSSGWKNFMLIWYYMRGSSIGKDTRPSILWEGLISPTSYHFWVINYIEWK